MGNSRVEMCKMAYEGITTALRGRNSVPAFDYKKANGIGEELIHRISGARFFKAEELNGVVAEVKSCPVQITDSGYKGISDEYFAALKKMRIFKKEQPYGGTEFYDQFSGTSYWDAGKNTLGETVAKAESTIGTEGRHTIPTSLLEKIQSYFSL